MKSAFHMAALLAAAATSPGLAGETLLSENFGSYAGTFATAPAGWYFSYHGHYTSSASSGPSGPNAYKFGEDQAAAVTPAFSGADSVSFWIRGNSTDSAGSLTVLWTADSTVWDTVARIVNIPTTATAFAFPLSAAATYLKFIYTKSKGNVAFDDLAVTGSGTTGLVAGRSVPGPVIYPNPVAGQQVVRILLPQAPIGPLPVRIFDAAGWLVRYQMLYERLNVIDIGHLPPGLYLIQMEGSVRRYTQKLVVQ